MTITFGAVLFALLELIHAPMDGVNEENREQ
jgi:hypothetical protein